MLQSARATLTRREMITRTALGLGVPMFVSRSALGFAGQPSANERVGIAAIGVGFRASLLLDQLPEAGRIVALCDCNLPRAEEYRKKRNGSWPILQNYRQLLDRKDIDAVIVATLDHQRILPCIHACQAGKDIYGEKPLTLYIREGRILVDAVRKHDRIFQVGSQQRSMTMNRVACQFIRNGGLGKIREVLAVNYPGPVPAPDKPLPTQPVPDGLDWSMWLNQAAWRDYNPQWMADIDYIDFCGGQMTNWGAHGIDQVQWALGTDDTAPIEMWPISPGLNGQVGMLYANGVKLNFVLDKGPMGGAVFIGDKGKIEVNRNKFASNPRSIAEELKKQVNEADEERKWSDNTALWQARWHEQNWLDSIRTRQKPVADVEIGHRSITVCHLANITRRLGRKLHWDPKSETFPGDAEANRLVNWPRRKEFELPSTL